MLVLLVVNIC